ncbi:MAG TPA: hypothetical protein VH988_17435 [Thermoanaerobaculia bacterium]|nr:hypothetical protein [Thermoanaerobaculia bacterium]
MRRTRRWCGCLVAALCMTSPLWAQDQAQDQPAASADEAGAAGGKPQLKWGLEAKMNYRRSEDNKFPVPFPFTPDQLPVGQTKGFEETVNAGSHIELSGVSLFLDGVWSESLKAHLKLDFISLYERNPTSTGTQTNVDEAWIQFGREGGHALLATHSGIYVRVGKMGKFERQNDRHLESYGLVSTAFNRIEDVGVEAGADLGQHFYVKGSYTSGNPVFMRDPNALAGDNGTPEEVQPLLPHPDPKLKTGVVILYDARVQDIDQKHPQTGLALGWRTADIEGRNGIDIMAWGRERKMAQDGTIQGSAYGTDIDLLNGPLDAFSFAIKNDRKREAGGNLWLYLGGFSFFAQYVDQDLAGLPRTGLEAEASWSFDLPLVWSLGGQQLFPTLAPAVRYSMLDNKFRNPPVTPSPSFSWDWTKIDAGLRLGIVGATDLTVEYANNDFILASGAHRNNNEYLATLHWRM